MLKLILFVSDTRTYGSIFICYRRGDSIAHAGRLYDRLSAHFGPSRIFMDIDGIEPGEDFVDVIEGTLTHCDAVSPDWEKPKLWLSLRRFTLVIPAKVAVAPTPATPNNQLTEVSIASGLNREFSIGV